MSGTELLTPMQYAALWSTITLGMAINIVGDILGVWGTLGPVYWPTLGLLLMATGLQSYEYYQRRLSDPNP
jgi:hypothetical protein